MADADNMTRLVHMLDGLLCSRVVYCIQGCEQVQGCIFLLVACVGWALSTRARSRALQKLHSHGKQLCEPRTAADGKSWDSTHAAKNGSVAAPCQSSSDGQSARQMPGVTEAPSPVRPVQPHPLPGVTVVLPVKGCRHYAKENWRSQLDLHYPGPLEFVFVSHSRDDIAFHTIEKLLKALESENKRVRARVLSSGHATSCSQKIHNLCHGISAASLDSKYVLCLDDDVQLHRNTLLNLVQHLEADSSLFLATGYPFDVPSPGSGLLTYCMLVYHLPLLIAFSVHEIVYNVWGGCMLMPLKHLRDDTYGIMEAWRHGGYSDDLTVAAKCNQHNLRIYCPANAIFVQYLEPRVTCAKFWNYLRRQTYVLDTYSDSYNQMMNWSLMAFSVYANWSVSLTMLLAGFRALVILASLARLPWLAILSTENMLKSATIGSAIGSSCPDVMLSSVASWVALSAAYLSCWVFCGTVIKLLNALSPTRAPLPAGVISHPLVWVALLIQCLLQPVCVLATLLMRDIEWSGIKYWKRNGRITHIQCVGDKRRACTK